MPTGITPQSHIDSPCPLGHLNPLLFLKGFFTLTKHGLHLAECLMVTSEAKKIWQDGKVQPGFLGMT